MEAIITTLQPILEDQTAVFGIRELARLTGINHTTIRKRMIAYELEGYVQKIETKQIFGYRAAKSQQFKMLKKLFNQKRIATLVTFLEREYNYPVIVLFGSYAIGEDVSSSDIDLCIITESTKEVNISDFQETLKKPIQLHVFTKDQWKNKIEKKHELVNSIVNGIVLSGHLEVVF